ALGVSLRSLIHGCAEEWDHPLVDGVLAVVTLPVREAGAHDRCLEAMGLRRSKHGHESTVAPAGEAEAVVIDRIARLHPVDARQDVAQVAVAHVEAHALGEALALAITAARVGHQHEVTHGRERHRPVAVTRPARARGRARPSMYVDDHGVALERIEAS